MLRLWNVSFLQEERTKFACIWNQFGHTIVGDELYGNGLNKELGINRQFLHAYKVRFTHPASKEEVELEIPIFIDMKDFLEK